MLRGCTEWMSVGARRVGCLEPRECPVLLRGHAHTAVRLGGTRVPCLGAPALPAQASLLLRACPAGFCVRLGF